MHHTSRVRQGQNYVMTGGFEIFVADMFLTKDNAQHWKPTVIAEVVNVNSEDDRDQIGKIVTLTSDEFDTMALDDSIPLLEREPEVLKVSTTARKAPTRKAPARKAATKRTPAKRRTTVKKQAVTS